MSLSINPLSQTVASISKSVSDAANQANAAFSAASNDLSKINLNDTVNRLSGAVGSGLNGFAGDLKNAASDISGAVSGLGGTVSGLTGAATAMGGIANQAQSLVSKVGTAAGSLSNITSDIATSINKLGSVGDLGSGIAGLSGLATQISKAAGQLSNILSLKRGANLPSNAELFSSRGAVVTMSSAPKSDWRVRINCNWELFNSPLFNNTVKTTGGVVWPYLPNITVSTKANYSTIDPVHNNFPFQAYKNSAVDDITIDGEFSCETEADAYYWIGATTFFRTVTKMFYGSSSFQGSPPPVCQLSGYGSSVFNQVPVIIKNFSVTFKDDVNYIKCSAAGDPTWVPVLSSISVTVSPIYNRSKLRQFSLQDFASGKTVGYI